MCVRYYNAFLFEQSDNAIIGTRKNFCTQTLRGGTHPNVHTGVFCPKRRKGIFQMASPFLPVFFNDMRVSEIQIDGPGGQPVMPYGQKTRNRLDSGGYDLAIAPALACMLLTPSRILNAD
jgi:hypothetical protein